jgi:site-specific recombinase XerD
MTMGQVVRIHDLHTPADDFAEARKAFESYCQSKNLSTSTVQYYGYRLQSFNSYLTAKHDGCSPADVTPAGIREFLLYEREQSSAATANHSLCTLRVFFKFLRDEGYIDNNPAKSISKMKTRKPVIETFSSEEVTAILNTCDKDFCGTRDRAIILILLDCGLRASELCGLELEDVDWTEQTFIVVGKGNKERKVPFGQGVRQALSSYISRIGNTDVNALFVTHDGEPLNRYRLREVVRIRCRRAGVTGLRCSPHTLRHTCAVSYLRAGGDTFTLQKLLGHSSQEMTRRYCESLQAEDVQAKHKQFSPVDNLKSIKTTRKRRLR